MLDFNIEEFPLKWRYGDSIRLKDRISLESIMLESERIREISKDLIVYKKDIYSRANEEGFQFSIYNKMYYASDWAVHYISASHGISKRYLSNLLSLAKERGYKPFIGLANDTINTFLNSPSKKERKLLKNDINTRFLADNKDKYLVRIIGDNYIRAIRSSNFKVKDNYPLLLDIKDTIEKYYILKSGIVDYNVLILRMYLDEERVLLKRHINIGLQLKNSETGYYALQIQLLISIDGVEFSSQTLLNIRHNAKAITTVDVNKYMEDVALRYKNKIFEAVENTIKNNKIEESYYSYIIYELKRYLNKDDYEDMDNLKNKQNKLELSKKILDICKNYNFIRKEKVESFVVDKILELTINV